MEKGPTKAKLTRAHEVIMEPWLSANLGWGNTRQRLGQTLQKGVLEPREPREGAIRKEGKTCQAIMGG